MRRFLVSGLMPVVGILPLLYHASTARSKAAPPDVQAASKVEVNLQELTHVALADFLKNRNLRTTREGRSIGNDVAWFATQSLGTPFQLGAPMFDLQSADCVTFTERCIALGCAPDWPGYYAVAQRLRHAGDSLSFLDRNFFPLTDWVPNNSWLLEDVTEQLGAVAVPFEYVVRPKAFFQKLEFGEDDSPLGHEKAAAKAAKIASLPEKIVRHDHYIPVEQISAVQSLLRDGDIWLTVRTREAPGLAPWYDSDHMGVLLNGDEGILLIHAAPPSVQQESLSDYLAGRSWVKGLKFMRVRADASTRVAGELGRLAARGSGHVGSATPQAVDRSVERKRGVRTPTPSGKCKLVTSTSATGPGCCDVSPPECAYYIVHYSSFCSADGNPPCQTNCLPFTDEAVTIVQYDCSGFCSNPNVTCGTTKVTSFFGNRTVSCTCTK